MKIKWRTDNPPEEVEEYLITNQYGTLEMADWTNKRSFSSEAGRWHWNAPMYSKVVAWMPLPEPYREDKTKAD